jgi:hypothetical protein
MLPASEITHYRIDVAIPLETLDLDPFAFSESLIGVVEQIDGLRSTDSGIGLGFRDIGFQAEGEASCLAAVSAIECFLAEAGLTVNDGEGSVRLHTEEEQAA